MYSYDPTLSWSVNGENHLATTLRGQIEPVTLEAMGGLLGSLPALSEQTRIAVSLAWGGTRLTPESTDKMIKNLAQRLPNGLYWSDTLGAIVCGVNVAQATGNYLSLQYVPTVQDPNLSSLDRATEDVRGFSVATVEAINTWAQLNPTNEEAGQTLDPIEQCAKAISAKKYYPTKTLRWLSTMRGPAVIANELETKRAASRLSGLFRLAVLGQCAGLDLATSFITIDSENSTDTNTPIAQTPVLAMS